MAIKLAQQRGRNAGPICLKRASGNVCAVPAGLAFVGDGFARKGTDNPNAFTVVNINDENTAVSVKVKGGESKVYHACRTTDDGEQ